MDSHEVMCVSWRVRVKEPERAAGRGGEPPGARAAFLRARLMLACFCAFVRGKPVSGRGLLSPRVSLAWPVPGGKAGAGGLLHFALDS